MTDRTTPDPFPTDPAGLPQAEPAPTVDLPDGGSYAIRIGPVAKRLGGDTVRMLAYNGSIPGPTLRVRQGSSVAVEVTNDGDLDDTVHWHGLRLENRYDGTHETQDPIARGGGRFTYRLTFPDPGLYWYHPHVREDYGQELGLYGNIVVEPEDPAYWPPANRELVLTLDDVLVEDGAIAAFDPATTTHSAMGRFGNLLLIAGETEPAFEARPGEVVRLLLTNTANTRVFNVALPGARLKLVGGDSGRVEREQLVESAVIAPSERLVLDALFEAPGAFALEHRTPGRTYRLASITVAGEPASPSYRAAFAQLRRDPELARERERLPAILAAEPDRTIALVAEMDLGAPEGGGPAGFGCPMHREVVSETAGTCPECGMKLLPLALIASSGAHGHHDHHDHGDQDHHHHDHGHHAAGEAGAPAGIEWEDDMVEVNRMTTPANTRWRIVDRGTGASGGDIDWRFRVGDRVKIRIVNEMDSDHPMHHPFHVHGAGRFLTVARDGVEEPNLVWSDTVLVPTGRTVDILLEVTNPGVWMAHCHIAEHHESGMMFTFTVDPATA